MRLLRCRKVGMRHVLGEVCSVIQLEESALQYVFEVKILADG